MRRALPLAVLAATFVMTGEAAALTCTSQATGNWSSAATWSGCGGGTPDGDDSASIVSPHDVTNDVATTVGSLALQNGATLTLTANRPVSGAFTSTGGTITGSGAVTVAGLFTKSAVQTLLVQASADLVLNGGGSLADGDINLDQGTMHVNSTLTIPDGNQDLTYISGSMPSGPALFVGPDGVIVEQDTTATVAFISATYENDGEIRAEAGALGLDRDGAGSTSNGDFRGETGGQIRFEPNSTLELGSGAALEGPGSVRLSNGTMNLAAGADVTVGELEVWGTLNVTGAGTYAPGTLEIGPFNAATVNSTRSGSAGSLDTERGVLSGNHTFTVGAFNKSSANELTITDGAKLVVNGPGSHSDGNVCLQETLPGISGDPALRINGAYTLPAALTNAMTCNQGTENTAHVIIGSGGTLDRPGPGATQIHTRTLVAGGTLAPPADESLGFSNELDMSSGAITVVPGGSITTDGMTVSGGTVTVGGSGGELFSSTDPLTLTGGVLTGTGEIKGAGVVNDGGTVAPGASPGTLTVDGPYTQGSGGTLATEVDGPGAGQFDVLAVTGAASLAGTVALDVGYSPADSDVIQFLTSASRTGTFGSLTGAGLSGARAFALDYPAGAPLGARLVVVQPPPPTAGTPTIGGTPEPGQTLSCDPGSWGSVAEFAYEWLRDGQVVAGGQSYGVTEEDRGHALTCRVTGSNATGSAQATSAAAHVPTAPPPAETPAPAPTPTPPTTTGGPTPEEIRLASASSSAVARALGFPARRCLSRRRFTIRVREPAGVTIASARITVAGKRVAVRRSNGRLTAVVNLRGLKRGRYTVKIVARTASGKTLTGKRRYRTCGAKRRRGGVPEL